MYYEIDAREVNLITIYTSIKNCIKIKNYVTQEVFIRCQMIDKLTK